MTLCATCEKPISLDGWCGCTCASGDQVCPVCRRTRNEGHEPTCRRHPRIIHDNAYPAAPRNRVQDEYVPPPDDTAERIAADAKSDTVRPTTWVIQRRIEALVARAVHDASIERAVERAVVGTSTANAIRQECDAVRSMLLAKNAAYGDSALDPVRVFSKCDTVEAIRVRIDDKLSRVARGSAAGEDTTLDLIGYLVLLRIAEARCRE